MTSALGGEILALDGPAGSPGTGDELGDLFRHAAERFAPNLWLAELVRVPAGAGGAPDAAGRRRSTASAGRCAWRAAALGSRCA